MNTLSISDSVFFVSSSKLLVESLFKSPQTASGVFKVRKNGILFLGGDGNPFAFLVANRFGERFFVSCRKNELGKGIRFFFSLMQSDEKRLGMPESKREQHAIAARLWDEIQKEGNA
jgi:hypothetical protein